MSKIIQALLSGAFFTFIIDFFIFLGIKENYIDFHKIDLYYNILFADNQNIFIFAFFTALFGYVTIYLSNKISLIIIGSLFVLSLSTLIPTIGMTTAELILMKKDVPVQTDKFSYRGDILYVGRKNVTFYDYKLEKNLTFEKNKIISEY